MNLGREIVACALRKREIRSFTEAGINKEFLEDTQDLSRVAIFTDLDASAFKSLLGHYAKHRKIPTLDMFRLSFPEGSYRLPDTDYDPDELIEIFSEDRQRYLSEIAAMDIADAVESGDFATAAEVMEKQAKLIRDSRVSKDIHLIWERSDIEQRINRSVSEGVYTGIKELDIQFNGFQRGHLITYLGRAKSGKSSFLLLSALKAWKSGRRVMFLTVEITAEGILDRLDSFASEISFKDYTMGNLTMADSKRLREFRSDIEGNSDFKIVQPMSKYTLTDLEYDIDSFEPDFVCVDGFYFMIDRNTGKTGASWEGHDNLAQEMKTLAMRKSIPIVTSMQVREKQLSRKKGSGIDDGAMMGGTGLVMASDMVLGFDVSDEMVHTISCTRSREGYLSTVKGKWNWDRCTFTVTEVPAQVNNSQFNYNSGD